MTFLVLMIILFVASLGVLGFGIYKMVRVIKSPTPLLTNYVLEIKRLGFIALGALVASTLGFIFLAMFQKYNLSAGEWVELILGSALFAGGLCSFIFTFFVHYYAKEIPAKFNKCLYYSIIVSGLIILIGLLLLTNAIADHITYPLVNGISFTKGFVTPASDVKPNIAWYAIFILMGAILVYVICDHRFYVEYGKHGILESTFLVAFPSGIIGARIGYVIGEWHTFVGQPWWKIFAIWEGGLTIVSGALVGIIVGVLWFIWRNKKYSIWLAVDIIVPTILVAQAIGRWGNFFNCEVHGYQVLKENWWFLPKIIANNAAYSESNGFAPTGYIYMPLFYIEFLSNLTGYFLMRFAIGKGLRKYLELGDLAFGYLVWYGMTRVIMEPLRDPTYNMGQDGYWSWLWSIGFVLIGAAAIFFNHLIRYLINRKKTQFKNVNKLFASIVSGVLFAGSAVLIALGALNMANGTQNTSFLMFNQFNNGLITLVVGLFLLFIFGCAVIYLSQGFAKKENVEKEV